MLAPGVLRWLTALAVCLVPPALLLGRGFHWIPGTWRSDFEFYFHPQRAFLSRWLSEGVFPFWNPHLFCGYPTVEIQQTALFYPFNSLLMALASPHVSMLLMLALHAGLCGLVAAATLRRFGRQPSGAAWLGAAAWSLGAVFSHRFYCGHLTVVFAMVWVPPAVLGFHAACRRAADRRDGAIVAAAAVGMVILAGAPQYVYYTIWGQAAVLGASLFRRPTVAAVKVAGLVWFTALAVSAVQWLPSLFYIPLSSRGGGFAQPPPSWAAIMVAALETILPFPLGDGRTVTHMQRRGIWDTAGFVGSVAILLALVSLLQARTKRPVRECASAPALWLFAFAAYLTGGGWLPGFDGFREPLKALCLVTLSLAWAAADGARIVAARGWSRTVLVSLAIVAAIPVAALTAATLWPGAVVRWVITLAEIQGGAHESVEQMLAELRANASLATTPLMRAAVLFLAGLAAGVVILWASRGRPRLAMAGLGAVVAVELLFVHGKLYVPEIPLDKSGWPPEAASALASAATGSPDGAIRTTIPTAMSNASQFLDGVGEPFGYDPLSPLLAGARTAPRLPGSPPEESAEAKRRALGLAYEMQDLHSTGPETVPQRDREFVLRRMSADARHGEVMPCVIRDPHRFTFGPTADGETFVSDDHAARVGESLVCGENENVANAGEAEIQRLATDTPNGIQYRVTTENAAVLVIRETWLPGWRATINGVSTPVFMVNGWMCGVALAPGTNEVRLQYRPPLFTLAAMISLSGCMALLSCAFAGRLIRRRHKGRLTTNETHEFDSPPVAGHDGRLPDGHGVSCCCPAADFADRGSAQPAE